MLSRGLIIALTPTKGMQLACLRSACSRYHYLVCQGYPMLAARHEGTVKRPDRCLLLASMTPTHHGMCMSSLVLHITALRQEHDMNQGTGVLASHLE